MGSTQEEGPEYRGVIARAEDQFQVITATASKTVYGQSAQSGRLYPVVLLAAAAAALALSGGDSLLIGVGLLAILLMGIWVGSGGSRRS